MASYILPDDGSDRIIHFDLIETELYESVSEITEHPVEVGIDITDHIRPMPKRVSLVAYTSNQPIHVNFFTQRGELFNFDLEVPSYFPTVEQLLTSPGGALRFGASAGINAIFGGPEFKAQLLAFADPSEGVVSDLAINPIAETLEQLTELQDNGVLCRIITPIKIYSSMVLERVSAPRQAGDSGVAFSIDARQLRMVQSGQIAAPPIPEEPSGVPEQAKGSQGAKPPGDSEDPTKPASLAIQALQGLGVNI
jgi:hypothetical protein